MRVKRSIRIKKLLRVITPKRAPVWARTTWWTGSSLFAGTAIGLAVITMLVVVAFYHSDTGPGAQKNVDTRVARAAVDANGSIATTSVGADGVGNTVRTSAPGADAKAARVTITGCLERSDETFKLTDTTGANPPKARSWKSAFLKKRPAQIEVVDTVKRLNLATHVGERVSVTGTLVDREMRAGSVQRVASSCASTPKTKI